MTGTSVALSCATGAARLGVFHYFSNVPPLKLERNPSGGFHQLDFTPAL
jgi:hypothetical protein